MALNKPILREANMKLKAMSQYGDSIKSGVWLSFQADIYV